MPLEDSMEKKLHLLESLGLETLRHFSGPMLYEVKCGCVVNVTATGEKEPLMIIGNSDYCNVHMHYIRMCEFHTGNRALKTGFTAILDYPIRRVLKIVDETIAPPTVMAAISLVRKETT